MRDSPGAAQLLAIIGETLRAEIIPALTGAPAYQARIAASLVAIVARELERAELDERAESARLRSLLNRDDGDLADLRAGLAERLRDGRLAIDDHAVADHLRATALAKLAVDQPSYPRYRALAEKA